MEQGALSYPVAALSAVFNRRTLAIILLLYLCMVVSNVLVVLSSRIEGASTSALFTTGAVLRVLCLILFPVAIITR